MTEFMQELENRLAQYANEADELRSRLEWLNGLISHAQALLEEETRSAQITPSIQSVFLSGNQPASNGRVEASQPVSEAIYSMLQQGQTRYSDMVRRIPQEYPRVQVKELRKGVSSALGHGLKTGRIRRVKRGIYIALK